MLEEGRWFCAWPRWFIFSFVAEEGWFDEAGACALVEGAGWRWFCARPWFWSAGGFCADCDWLGVCALEDPAGWRLCCWLGAADGCCVVLGVARCLFISS